MIIDTGQRKNQAGLKLVKKNKVNCYSKYSQTSVSDCPKCQVGGPVVGGCLQEVVTYESVEHIRSKFCLISIR